MVVCIRYRRDKGSHMNIVNAIMNLVNNPIVHIVPAYKGNNRANNAGDALEEYVKDLFADSFSLSENERLERINQAFSYLGNSSNPPDAMLRRGDAIEVKKIESTSSALALNSSYPKHTLLSSSQMISTACRNAEKWKEKDIIYVVGAIDANSNDLKRLCMVYGLDYCASEECYSRIKRTIKEGVESIPDVEFAETNELGRINKVDPLGITYMRIRGMWGIENPWRTFDYIYSLPITDIFSFMCIINDEKWKTLDNRDELYALAKCCTSLQIRNVRVKDPDNPARLNGAKLITFSVKRGTSR